MTVVPYELERLPASQPGDELLPGAAGWVARLRAAAEIAGYIGGTDFVPQALRDNPAAIAAAILYGDELGLSPMQSLAKIAVIRGKPTLTAEAQRALVASRGHRIWVEEATVTRAIVCGIRQGDERTHRVTWTMDDAKRAGLAGQQNYRSYPREMLVARASAALCRQLFADVIGGMPAAEELEGEELNGSTPQAVAAVEAGAQPAAPAQQRRRRTRAAAEAPPPPDTAVAPPADAPEPAMSEPQKRKLFALVRDAGIEDDRDARMLLAQTLLEREVESFAELSGREAGILIDYLESAAADPGPQGAAEPQPPAEEPFGPAEPEPAGEEFPESEQCANLIDGEQCVLREGHEGPHQTQTSFLPAQPGSPSEAAAAAESADIPFGEEPADPVERAAQAGQLEGEQKVELLLELSDELGIRQVTQEGLDKRREQPGWDEFLDNNIKRYADEVTRRREQQQ